MTRTRKDRRDGDLVHRFLLDEAARVDSHAAAMRFPEEDTSWTWAAARSEADGAARHLQSLGVSRGDVVAFIGLAGSQYVLYFLGALWLGAVVAPMNHAYRGSILAHVLRTSAARVMVVDGDVLGRLADLDLGDTRLDVVCYNRPVPVSRLGTPANVTVHCAVHDRPPRSTIDVPGIHYRGPYAISRRERLVRRRVSCRTDRSRRCSGTTSWHGCDLMIPDARRTDLPHLRLAHAVHSARKEG